jgi:hypothetical protein
MYEDHCAEAPVRPGGQKAYAFGVQAERLEAQGGAQEACAAGSSAEAEERLGTDAAAPAAGEANGSLPAGEERRWAPGGGGRAGGGRGRGEARQTWAGRAFDSPAVFWAALVFAPGMQVWRPPPTAATPPCLVWVWVWVRVWEWVWVWVWVRVRVWVLCYVAGPCACLGVRCSGDLISKGARLHR